MIILDIIFPRYFGVKKQLYLIFNLFTCYFTHSLMDVTIVKKEESIITDEKCRKLMKFHCCMILLRFYYIQYSFTKLAKLHNEVINI
jgi:hypothetical protein